MNLTTLIQTTYHYWTVPISPAQLTALVEYRGLLDALASVQDELATTETTIQNQEKSIDHVSQQMSQNVDADDEAVNLKAAYDLVTELCEASRLELDRLEAEEGEIIAQIESAKTEIYNREYQQIGQLRIALLPSNGRSEAAYRGLMAEAGAVFREWTGFEYDNDKVWPAHKRAELGALLNAFSTWARAMGALDMIEARTIDGIEYAPDDYSDEPACWEISPIPEEWRDPATALEIIPQDLLMSMANQALIASRGTFDTRFFPAGAKARKNGKNDISQ